MVYHTLKWIGLIALYSLLSLLGILVVLRFVATLILPVIHIDILAMVSYLSAHFALIFAVMMGAILVLRKQTFAAAVMVAMGAVTMFLDGDHRLGSQQTEHARALPLQETDRDHHGRSFTVMAFNAQCYTKGRQTVTDYMTSGKADIVLLSENCSEDGRQIEKIEVGEFQWLYPGHATTILSKYPIVSAENVMLPTPEVSLTKRNSHTIRSDRNRQFLHAKIKIGNEDVNFVSLRLIAGRAPSRHPIDRLTWGYQLYQFQKAEMAFVQDYLRGIEGPIILGGDLNAPPKSYPLRILTESLGFRDTSLDQHYFGGFTFRNETVPTMRLDFLLASQQVETVHSEILPDKVSDHFPLIGQYVVKKL